MAADGTYDTSQITLQIGKSIHHMRRRRNDDDDDRRRPIVILAGWLGCHPKNLQRHVQMYDRLGYNSLIRIPSPASVVHAMQDGPENQNDVGSNSLSLSKEMKHIAITTLQHIQQLQPPHFIIHIFSNSGCFLWEWIRFILFGSNRDNTGINTTYHLQNKLRCIIFDSAPAYYHGKIDGFQSALEYVGNEEERVQLVKMANSLNSTQVERRHNEFWSGLRNDSQSTSLQKKAAPQLYLYSDCDTLANMKYIDELVVHRRQIIGKERVWSHKFIGSSHCGHLKTYPTMYEHTVQDFLEFCIAPDGYKRCRL